MKRFVRGSLYVECRGDCERLLRRCAESGVALWDTRRTEELGMRFWCASESIYTLRRICRGASCSLRVLKKRGAPFVIRRICARPVLIAGFGVMFALLWLMGTRVWNIEITAEGDTDTAAAAHMLHNAGLHAGMPIRSVRANIIRNSVMEQSDRIAFLTVNMQGTTAKVHIFEKDDRELERLPEICDIVSGLTGIITDIRIKNGTSQVRKWQSIYEGDLIASAEMTDKHGRVRQVRADAEIDVRSVYTRRCAVAKELFEYIPTQNTKKRSYLVVGNRSIKLYLIEKIEYKWYYKDVCRKTLSLREGFDLPVTLVTETYTECLRQDYSPSDGQLERLLEGRMTTAFLLQRPAAVALSSSFNLLTSGNHYEGIMRLECSETTGIQIAR